MFKKILSANCNKVVGLVLVIIIVLISNSLLIRSAPNAEASHTDFAKPVVYFSGVGCPHCAAVDPIMFKDWIRQYPELVIVEYEIYQTKANAYLIDYYNQSYNIPLGIPLAIFNKNVYLSGDQDILKEFTTTLKNKNNSNLVQHDGLITKWEDTNLNSLAQFPKIWQGDRIAIKTKANLGNQSTLIKEFLSSNKLSEFLNNIEGEFVEPKDVNLSGSKISFDQAFQTNGWLLQWRGEYIDPSSYTTSTPSSTNTTPTPDPSSNQSQTDEPKKSELSFAKTISLALVDAINPCALAVLTMLLLAIISYNPGNRKQILLAGFSFSLAVFLMYLIYGLIIVKFFQMVQAITAIRTFLRYGLAIAAIILGLLQIKDFISYKAGTLGTEMPMFLRPKVKKIVSGVTSPWGAFGIGLFVTLFLLPCTIGPYVILGGILSAQEMLATIPYLLLYNAIFVLPMVLITALVFFGISQVKDVNKWKNNNIRYIHLASGLIIMALGVAMLFGWV